MPKLTLEVPSDVVDALRFPPEEVKARSGANWLWPSTGGVACLSGRPGCSPTPMVICDSSSLIHLAGIGRLGLLRGLYRKLIVPTAGERGGSGPRGSSSRWGRLDLLTA
jgi:hypothetical protein